MDRKRKRTGKVICFFLAVEKTYWKGKDKERKGQCQGKQRNGKGNGHGQVGMQFVTKKNIGKESIL